MAITAASINSATSKDLVNSIDSAQNNKILLDNICNWYLFEGQIILGFNILKKYENIFKANLLDYNMDKQYYYRPEYVCNLLYNTPDLWYLLLFVNDMSSVDDFTRDKIKVFDSNRIEIINEIINNEKELISTKEEPRYIRKHFLKNLNEDSKDIIGNQYYDETGYLKSPSSINKLSYLADQKYRMSKLRVEKGNVIDSNGNKINPFELMNGIYNIPSCFYKNGYNNTYKGKIYLDSSKEYSILKLLNGQYNFILKNYKGETIYNSSEEIYFDKIDLKVNIG